MMMNIFSFENSIDIDITNENVEIIKHYQNLLQGEKFYYRIDKQQLIIPFRLKGSSIETEIHIVVVKPTKECKRIVKELMKENPSNTSINDSYSFMHGKKTIHVFFLKKCNRTTTSTGQGFDYNIYGTRY